MGDEKDQVGGVLKGAFSYGQRGRKGKMFQQYEGRWLANSLGQRSSD
jgi:hypothetical protein